MSEALYAALGRKQLELETLHLEYDSLLGLLAAVVEGEIAPELVVVDRQARRWEVLAKPQEAATAMAASNGYRRPVPTDASEGV